MSELKAFELKIGKNLETDSPLVVGVDDKWNSRVMSGEKVYLKSEADKVIAELKERVREERSMKVDYKISANDLSDGLKKAYEEIAELKQEIEQLKKENEMTLVGVNLRSPTSDGRFV